MNKTQRFFFILLFSTSSVFGKTVQSQELPPCYSPQGWSFGIGGSYTWNSFSSPPTFSGSTGGVLGKVTYQMPDSYFGQARSYYNIGPLSSSVNDTSFQESYSEFIGGYCVTALKNWTITPYLGLGFDFLFDDRSGYGYVAPIDLKYTIYYAIAGLETHYVWPDWTLGFQVDCFPTFNQYLKVKGIPGTAWTLKNRVGAEVQIPFSYRYHRNYWLEFAPYYRFFPVGRSSVLGLPERNLNQWGAFLTFRFYL